jgi:hypothetical protein
MKTVSNNFTFRSFPLPTLASVPTGVKPATIKQAKELSKHSQDFTLGEATYTVNGVGHTLPSAKRNSVEASFTVPDVAEIATSTMLAAIVERTVQDFVKREYIDAFAPVGAHDWATIEAAWLAAQEATGGFSACPCTDEDFKEAQAVFSDYLDKVAPKFSPLASKVIANRCAKRQVESCLANFGVSEITLNNLLNRIVQAIENTPNASEGVVEALAYCAERVQAHIKALATVSVNTSDM